MQLKRAIYDIHLLLGLISGIIVFIVSITGCFYAFKAEIESLTQPYRHVAKQEQSFQDPSRLISVARDTLPERNLQSITYGQRDDAAEVIFYEADPEFHRGVFLNPYTGEVLKVKDYSRDFFQFIFDGHFQLWLPRHIGKPIVSTGVLIFVVLLITGIVLWWPKRKAERESFRIHWKAPWKRRYFDLHSVLGFYFFLILLIIALTGLVWGFQWFGEALYSATGGEKQTAFRVPGSDTTAASSKDTAHPLDYVWHTLSSDHPGAAEIAIFAPAADQAIYAYANPDEQTYWKTEYRYFDQNTLEEIEVETIWGKMEDAALPDKIRRLNYDIHTGAIAGLPGKIIAFLASLVAASLPVTGFLLWWRKRKEKKKMASRLDL